MLFNTNDFTSILISFDSEPQLNDLGNIDKFKDEIINLVKTSYGFDIDIDGCNNKGNFIKLSEISLPIFKIFNIMLPKVPIDSTKINNIDKFKNDIKEYIHKSKYYKSSRVYYTNNNLIIYNDNNEFKIKIEKNTYNTQTYVNYMNDLLKNNKLLIRTNDGNNMCDNNIINIINKSIEHFNDNYDNNNNTENIDYGNFTNGSYSIMNQAPPYSFTLLTKNYPFVWYSEDNTNITERHNITFVLNHKLIDNNKSIVSGTIFDGNTNTKIKNINNPTKRYNRSGIEFFNNIIDSENIDSEKNVYNNNYMYNPIIYSDNLTSSNFLNQISISKYNLIDNLINLNIDKLIEYLSKFKTGVDTEILINPVNNNNDYIQKHNKCSVLRRCR